MGVSFLFYQPMKALILSSLCSLLTLCFLSPQLSDRQVLFFTVVAFTGFFMCFSVANPGHSLPKRRSEPKPKAAPQKQRKAAQDDGDSMQPPNDDALKIQMAEYRRWCVQVIGHIVVTEKLNVALVRTVTGALTITFVLKLLHPNKTELDKLLSLANVFAQALQLEAVRLANSSQGILLELPSPVAHTPHATALTGYCQGANLCIGVDTFHQPVLVSLKQHGAIGWIGPSRRGKTQSLKSCLYNLLAANPHKIRFIIFAQKFNDWSSFTEVAGCGGIFHTADAIEAAFQRIDAALNQQAAAGRSAPTLVICDDLVNLLNLVPSLAEKLENLASMGAGVGFHLLFGSQMAGSKKGSGGMAVEANLTARILYKPASNATGARNAGTKHTQLDLLSEHKGDALAVIDGVATRIATSLVDDATIHLLPKAPKAHAAPSVPVAQPERAQPAARTSGVLTIASGVTPVPVPTEPTLHAQHEQKNGVRAAGTLPAKLANQPPTLLEKQQLRQLFQATQSKNAVLKMAYGGVVNESGKTPKTLKWLNEALAESAGEQPASAPEPVEVAELLQQANWEATVKHLRARRLAKNG